MKLLKNKKRLNNKGFTLIELLAVVVILAVVMGIAMTSVLSSMNNSRKGSLQNSAKSVAQAFQTKYSEAMVTGQMNNVYGDVLKTTAGSTTTTYDFNVASDSNPVFYYLTDGLKDELNLSPSTYRLTSGISSVTVGTEGEGEAAKKVAYAKDSFVAFNGSTVVVCLFANQSGSYYVADFAKTNGNTEIFGVDVHFTTGYTTSESGAANVGTGIDMWSCSLDDVNSWTEVVVEEDA